MGMHSIRPGCSDGVGGAAAEIVGCGVKVVFEAGLPPALPLSFLTIIIEQTHPLAFTSTQALQTETTPRPLAPAPTICLPSSWVALGVVLGAGSPAPLP